MSQDKRKPTEEEMNVLTVFLAMAKHVIHCKKCAAKQAEIMNHAQIPSKDILDPGVG